MSLKYLNLTGLSRVVTNLKNWVVSQIPTKTSEITNDSGFITSSSLPTVNNATLTIQKNGTNVQTFTANASSNKTANITVPTKTSELTNDSGFLSNTLTNNTSKGALGWSSSIGTNIPTLNTIAYWNGAYTNAASNLAYCVKGAFGDIVTHNASEFLTSHQSLSNYVTLDGAQTISGEKTFSKYPRIKPTTANNGLIYIQAPDITFGTAPSTTYTYALRCLDSDGTILADFLAQSEASGYTTMQLRVRNTDGTNVYDRRIVFNVKDTDGATTFRPNADAIFNLGTSSYKWKAVYSNSYYLGSTAFGDIVTHNASEYASSSHTHTVNDISNFPTLATVATSGSYNDLSNKPTIPTVNNATLTIQKNGTTVKTFTANASSNVTCNITVPTKTSEITNDSGFLTSHQSLSNYSTLANTVKSLSISGKTITVTPGSGNAYTLTTQDTTYSNFVKSGSGAKAGLVPAPSTTAGTTKYLREDGTWQVPPDHTYTVNNATLTIQKNGSNVATFTSNASSNVTANITVPTKTSELTNNSGFLTAHQDLSLYPYKETSTNNWEYLNLGDTTTYPSGYDAVVDIGKYHIRGTASTPGTPCAFNHGGLLIVDQISTESNVSSHRRCTQIFYRLGAGSIFTIFIRRGYYNSGWIWQDWEQIATTGDIPTKTSELTNDSGFLTSHQSLSNYSTKANTVKSLSISGKTITVTPGSGNAYTLTTQDTVYTHPTSAGNKHIPSGGSSGQILKYSSSGTAVWADVGYIHTMDQIASRTTVDNGTWSISCTAYQLMIIAITSKGSNVVVQHLVNVTLTSGASSLVPEYTTAIFSHSSTTASATLTRHVLLWTTANTVKITISNVTNLSALTLYARQ